MAANEANPSFEDVKARLDEIVDAVGDENISLDAALDLYEEAVKLGMQASTLLEEGIAAQEDAAEQAEGNEADAALLSGDENETRGASADERSEDEAPVVSQQR